MNKSSGVAARSLFGGPLSTRAECVTDLVVNRLLAEQEQLEKKALKGIRSSIGSTDRKLLPRLKPAPHPDPTAVKREKLKKDLETFDDLNSDAPAPKPQPKQSHAAADVKKPSTSHTSISTSNGLSSHANGRRQSNGHVSNAALQRQGVASTSGRTHSGKTDPAQHSLQPLSSAMKQPAMSKSAPGTAHAIALKDPVPGHPLASTPPAMSSKKQQLLQRHMELLARQQQTGKQIPQQPPQPPNPQQRQQQQQQQQLAGVKRKVAVGHQAGFSKNHGRSGRPWSYHDDYYDDEDDYEDDFVVDDDGQEDWRVAMRRLTGYDPRRWQNERDDDRSMEVSWAQLQAEERRSERLGRKEDEEAEEDERLRKEAKLKKKLRPG